MIPNSRFDNSPKIDPLVPLLSSNDLANFGKLGIPSSLLAEAHVRRVSDSEAREQFGIVGPASKNMAGIVFPYFIPACDYRVTARVRRDHPEIEDGKPKNKYISAYGDAKHLYFPRAPKEMLQNPDTEIVLVEAEKSALALTAWAEREGKRILAVGLGGCWGWRGRIGKDIDAAGERVDVTGVLPDLSACDGRTVYVCLDANAATSSKVQAARAALVRELRKRGCKVLICSLPLMPGVNGPDDFVAVRGDSAMRAVLELASTPAAKQSTAMNASSLWEQAEGMDSFLADADESIAWLIPDTIAPGRLTEIFAPRGLGKSILALHWAVTLATQGMRVMLLDRDNPKYTIKQRLRGLGAADLSPATLRVISREKCPPLTQPDAWWSFPYSDFDLVIVDSLDSMAEGVGEQDSSKPARAMAPLLDICHRENGPAVLLLGNTIKSAAHSRGSGVVEDRSDIVFEARDATDFRPTGTKPWIEELPEQGASNWATRSTRRTRRTKFRLALIATKFRDGEEPTPRVFEISMDDEPWRVTDVTVDVDGEGEAELKRTIEAKAATISKGVAALLEELKARSMLKREAEDFLQGTGLTRKLARQIVGSDSFQLLPVPGKGSPLKVVMAAKMPQSETPSNNANFNGADFGRPLEQRTAIINPSETLINKGDLETPILAADPILLRGSEQKNGNENVDHTAEEKETNLWF